MILVKDAWFRAQREVKDGLYLFCILFFPELEAEVVHALQIRTEILQRQNGEYLLSSQTMHAEYPFTVSMLIPALFGLQTLYV